MSGARYFSSVLLVAAIVVAGGLALIEGFDGLRTRPASVAPNQDRFVVIHEYGIVDGYNTGMLYDPRADVVCWYRGEALDCTRREDTDLSVDAAMLGAR